jgi:hypothetical protein
MNQRLRELMIEAGYPAPEIAKRAHRLTELIIRDCEKVIKDWKDEPFPFDEDLAVRLIKDQFGVK